MMATEVILALTTMQLYIMHSHSCMPHYPAFRVLTVRGGGRGLSASHAACSDLDITAYIYVDSNKVVDMAQLRGDVIL